MPFTAEEKKAHRKKKKAEEELQKQVQKRKTMETRIPDNKLKKPLDKDKVGAPMDDCGAHQKALNCHAIPFDNSVNEVQLTFNGEGEDISGPSGTTQSPKSSAPEWPPSHLDPALFGLWLSKANCVFLSGHSSQLKCQRVS